MMDLLFSPKGRVGPSEFMRGVWVLIAITAVLKLLPLVSFTLSNVLGIAGIVMLWCWIVLWVKRYHDAGKSGWMSLIPIIIYMVLGVVGGNMITEMFAGDLQAQMNEVAVEAAGSSDFVSIFKSMMNASESAAKKLAIPTAIFGVVLSAGIAYIFNGMIKHDPNENQYGTGGSIGETFN